MANQDTDYDLTTSALSLADDSDAVRGETFASDAFYQFYRILLPAVFTIIILLGLVGNCLVIHVIASRRKLQTATNLLLLNLAVADVSFSIVCGGFSVVHYVLTEWPLGDTVCRLIQYLLFTTCYVMVYTLMAVSVVRYFTVVYGVRAAPYLTRRKVCAFILAMWVVFLVAKIPVLMVHSVSYDPSTNRTECIIIGRQEGREFFATFFIFAYALPLVVICTLYVKVVCYLRAQKSAALTRRTRRPESRKRHVTKIVILVVAVFALCWLPLHIHLLVAYYGRLPETATYKLMLVAWHSLVYINSLLNPIIYNYFARDFRAGMLDAVRCRALGPDAGEPAPDEYSGPPEENTHSDPGCTMRLKP